MRSLLNLIIVACGAIALALAVGLLRPGLSSATLQSHAQQSIARCMHQAGFQLDGPPELVVEQASSPRDRALERCWSNAATDPRFKRLAMTDPIGNRKRWRAEGFRVWRCVERSGYVRTTDVQLSGPGGWPLQVAAGNFRVGRGERELARFYRAAAKCSREPIDAYRLPNGKFSPEPTDGARCIRHQNHSHGCYRTRTYPGGSE
jgi:hypothetical protein